MTYIQFHYVFLFPVIGLLLWLNWSHFHRGAKPFFVGLAIMTFLAVTYTTPWDNYLVYKQVWWYGADRVMGTIGYVPIEEYMFFVLQTWASGLFFCYLFYSFKKKGYFESCPPIEQIPKKTTSLLFLALFATWIFSVAALFNEKTLYLGLILSWSLPVVAIQWAAGFWTLWRFKKLVLLSIFCSSAYFWIADALAIHWNIWSIAERYTVGWHVAGLPLEEALFFLVTNIMVVQGLILFWVMKPQALKMSELKLGQIWPLKQSF